MVGSKPGRSRPRSLRPDRVSPIVSRVSRDSCSSKSTSFSLDPSPLRFSSPRLQDRQLFSRHSATSKGFRSGAGGVLGTGLFVTSRTQWLLAVARWVLALGIVATYATAPFRDLRGLAGGGLLLLSPPQYSFASGRAVFSLNLMAKTGPTASKFPEPQAPLRDAVPTINSTS